MIQKPVALLGRTFWRGSEAVREVSIGDASSNGNGTNQNLLFFEDSASQRWRYPEWQYEELALNQGKDEYLIFKKGRGDRYLRVCQWKFGARQPAPGLIARLVRMAERDRALGVRWAVYGDDEASNHLVRRLKNFSFFCARRDRTLLIYAREREFLSAKNWHLTDAMFSFDP